MPMPNAMILLAISSLVMYLMNSMQAAVCASVRLFDTTKPVPPDIREARLPDSFVGKLAGLMFSAPAAQSTLPPASQTPLKSIAVLPPKKSLRYCSSSSPPGPKFAESIFCRTFSCMNVMTSRNAGSSNDATSAPCA